MLQYTSSSFVINKKGRFATKSYFYNKKFGKHTRWKYLLQMILMLLFLFSTLMVVKQLVQEYQDRILFQNLSFLVAQSANQASTQTHILEPAYFANETKIPVQDHMILPQYTALYEKNRDLIGWLKIANTKIDVPVMFTPSEPDYYLHHAFDKTQSQSGTPFVDSGSTIDSDCFIIHGHNMKNNTVFGTLDYYQDPAFFLQNKTFLFDTLYEHREYEIFAILRTHILNMDEDGFRYYHASGKLTDVEYTELVNWLAANSLYTTNITPVYGEQILILSTCSNHTENGRFIVAARRK